MIRVTVDFLPGGYAAFRRTIGLMHIANISDLARVSDYRVQISEGDNRLAGTAARACTVFVRGHNRAQSVWALVGAALVEAQAAGFSDQ